MGMHGTESTNGEAAASTECPTKSKYAAICLLWNMAKSHAFHASLRLRIPDILAKAEAEGKPGLSAEEIVAHLPGRQSPGGPEVAGNLKRLLEPLLEDGLYARSVVHGGKILYQGTDISKWFVQGNEFNILGITGFQRAEPVRKAFDYLEYAILDDSRSPFEIANGASLYEYVTKDSEFATVVSSTMTGFSNYEMPQLLETLQRSGVLQGAKNLVDVGGDLGTFLAHIIDRNPHIHGINFDLPHVISTPEVAKGVEHVGGNFFESVPSGDIMILKMILHNFGDEENIRILRRCYEALPEQGKVLVVEYVLPEVEEQHPGFEGKNAVGMDLAMLAYFRGGRERSMKEYEALLAEAGFSSPTLISSPDCIAIIQAFKSQ